MPFLFGTYRPRRNLFTESLPATNMPSATALRQQIGEDLAKHGFPILIWNDDRNE